MSPRRWVLALTAPALVAGWSGSVCAQDSTWHIIGQVRPRMELRDGYRTLPDKYTDAVLFFSQRSRLGARYSSNPRLALTVILQDVRTWGDETSTSADYSADNFDVYRAFADLRPDSQWTIRIGRQGLGYDEERILGDADWPQQGRTHDAIRVMWDNGRLAAHAAWAHNETDDPIFWTPYSHTANYQDLALLWLQARRPNEAISFLCLYDDHDLGGAESLPFAGLPTDRWTVGARLEGRRDRIHSRAEGYYQFGHRVGFMQHAVVKSGMFALELDRDFGRTNAMLWFDYLTGDDKPYDNEFKAFDPPYATTHKFYGWADYFVNVPADAYGRGLEDLALKLKTPIAGESVLDAQFHYFWLAKPYETFDSDKKSKLGFEMDLMATIPLLKFAGLQCGYSLLLPSEFTKDITGGNSSGHWLWMMLDVNVK